MFIIDKKRTVIYGELVQNVICLPYDNNVLYQTHVND